jgi:hypothetical protein
MKITLNNIEIELTNKINVFIPSKDITDIKFDDFKDSIENIDNLFELYTKDFSHPVKQKDYFLNFPPNKKKLNDNAIFLYCITTNPLLLLWLPEDSCVWKVDLKEIKKFDSKYYRNMTPNTILTSEIFDFNEIIPDFHKPYERLKTGKYSEEEYFDLLEQQMKRTLTQRNL